MEVGIKKILLKKVSDFIKSNNPPSREPDFIDNIATLPQSALLYRLCGDMNPLHADPTVAKEGFNRPSPSRQMYFRYRYSFLG